MIEDFVKAVLKAMDFGLIDRDKAIYEIMMTLHAYQRGIEKGITIEINKEDINE